MPPAKQCRIGWIAYGLVALVFLCSLPSQAQQGGPSVVEVDTVVQRTIAQPVTLVGTVEPARRSRVASEIEGIVKAVAVEEGQMVTSGDPLVRLRQERLRLTLKQRQASAERFRQEFEELRRGTRPEFIDEARAEVQEAEAELAQARREQTRQRGLNARGVAAERAREDADTAVQVAEQRLARARARYQVAVRGPRAERIAQAEAQYRAAQADVARLQYDLERTTLRAPFSGFVVAQHTEVGQWLGRGDDAITLIDLSPAHITVPVPERYIPEVRVGLSGVVQLDAFPGRTWSGRVIRVIPEAGESRTFPVTVAVPNPQAAIKSGLVARVTLTIGDQQEALMVPKDAIVSQGPRLLVFVVRDGKAMPVPVQRTTFYEGFAVVEGALKPGESVVVRGNERLRPGQPVRIAPRPSGG